MIFFSLRIQWNASKNEMRKKLNSLRRTLKVQLLVKQNLNSLSSPELITLENTVKNQSKLDTCGRVDTFFRQGCGTTLRVQPRAIENGLDLPIELFFLWDT